MVSLRTCTWWLGLLQHMCLAFIFYGVICTSGGNWLTRVLVFTTLVPPVGDDIFFCIPGPSAPLKPQQRRCATLALTLSVWGLGFMRLNYTLHCTRVLLVATISGASLWCAYFLYRQPVRV